MLMKTFLSVGLISAVALLTANAQYSYAPRYVYTPPIVISQGGVGMGGTITGAYTFAEAQFLTIDNTNVQLKVGGALPVMDGGQLTNLFNNGGRTFLSATSNNIAGSISVKLGSPANYILPTAHSSTIGGGGETGGAIDYTNAIHSKQSTIAGGVGNYIGIDSDGSTIGGGEWNKINEANGMPSVYATIAGGEVNQIGPDCADAFIGGGFHNTILEGSFYGTIVGGYRNVASGVNATILGGFDNHATGDGTFAIGNYVTNTTPFAIKLGYRDNLMTINTNGNVNITDNFIAAGYVSGTKFNAGANTRYDISGITEDITDFSITANNGDVIIAGNIVYINALKTDTNSTAPIDAATIKAWVNVTDASGQVFKMPLYK
jgi:hypothetical protein